MYRSSLVLCSLLCLLLGIASATAQTRPRRVSDPQTPDSAPLPEASPSPAPNRKSNRPPPPVLKNREKPLWAGAESKEYASAATMPLADRLQAAIETRLGTPYRYGSVSGTTYDCSGFVWSVFQEVGAGFTRDSARHYWDSFSVPEAGEEYRFGTLVFFNRLTHVGIVAADGLGFYHASSSQGVTYSSFDKYWTPRITGFRRVPLENVENPGAADTRSLTR